MSDPSSIAPPPDRTARGLARLVAFIRDLDHEIWEWSPEEGAPSAKSVIASLLAEEKSLRDRRLRHDSEPARAARGAQKPPETPADAVRLLIASRAATCETLKSAGFSREEEDRLFLRLAFAEGVALGEIALLLRLVDPSRAVPALL